MVDYVMRLRISTAPAASQIVLLGESVKNASGSGADISATVRVNAASNRLLVAAIFSGGGTTVPDTITGATATGYNGVAVSMTLAASEVVSGLSSRNHRVSVFYLLDPPLGDVVVTGTRGTTQALRYFMSAAVFSDVDQSTPIIDVQTKSVSAAGSPTVSDSVATTQDELMVVTAFSGFEVTSADTGAALADQTAVQNCEGSDYYGGLSYQRATAAGLVTMGATTGGANWRSAALVSISIKPTAHAALEPIFYIDPDLGDDENDGLSAETAVASLGRAALFPYQAGAMLRGKGGTFARRTGPPATPAEFAFTLDASGNPVSPIRIESYGTGRFTMLGDVAYPTGWTPATEAETSTAFFASIEKRDMGSPLEWGNAVCCGGALFQPAQWSLAGYAAGIYSWNDSTDGSDAYYHYSAAEYGGTSDSSKMVSYVDNGDGSYTITIKHADIGTHYGTNSPVGAGLAFRGAGSNTPECAAITGYDEASGAIICVTDHYPATAELGGYWAVRYHPRDLQTARQYAYSADRQWVFGAFPDAGARSVIRYNNGVSLAGDYIEVEGVNFGRACADPTLQQSILNCSGSFGSVTDSTIAQGGLDGEPNMVEMATGSDTWAFNNIYITEGATSSGFRLFGSNAAIDGATVRDLGRTCIYFGGNSSGSAVNVDVCEQVAVHGNGFTAQQRSSNVSLDKFGVMNSISPITSQIEPESLRVKSSSYSRGILTGSRDFAGSITNAYLFRFDGGDYDTQIDRTIAMLSDVAGNVLADNLAPNTASNTGMVWQRSAMVNLGISAGAGSGVTLKDLLTTQSGGTSVANWTATGLATVLRSENDTSQNWTGALTDKMWEYTTRADGGGGAAGAHEAYQLGPDAWDWQIPAYGTVGAMVDLRLTTDEVWEGLQQEKAFASVIRARPGSTLSLPVGVTNNDDFALDRGTLRHTAGALTSAKTITVRETNAAASNGPTRDTVLSIAIRDPAATFS
jgi:hypothetical protein